MIDFASKMKFMSSGDPLRFLTQVVVHQVHPMFVKDKSIKVDLAIDEQMAKAEFLRRQQAIKDTEEEK